MLDTWPHVEMTVAGGKEENVAQVKESVPKDEKSQVLGGRLSMMMRRRA